METVENKTLTFFVRENLHLMSRPIGLDCGWGNGYVCLPEGHPLYGMDYDAIHDKLPELSVHYGLTFSESSENLEWPEVPEGKWWIVGFDTAHYNDNAATWPKHRVELEAKNLMRQLEIQ